MKDELSATEFAKYLEMLKLRARQRIYVMAQRGRDDICKVGVSTDPQGRVHDINSRSTTGASVELCHHRALFAWEMALPLRSPKPSITWSERWVRHHFCDEIMPNNDVSCGYTEWYRTPPSRMIEWLTDGIGAMTYDRIDVSSPKEMAINLMRLAR